MTTKTLKRIGFVLIVLSVFLLSVITIVYFDGRTGSKHISGIVNLGLAVGFVHIIDLCDDRWSLYNEIIEEQNLALAIAYAGWIIGACIAFPSSIL
jgi:hypothetical protein